MTYYITDSKDVQNTLDKISMTHDEWNNCIDTGKIINYNTFIPKNTKDKLLCYTILGGEYCRKCNFSFAVDSEESYRKYGNNRDKIQWHEKCKCDITKNNIKTLCTIMMWCDINYYNKIIEMAQYDKIYYIVDDCGRLYSVGDFVKRLSKHDYNLQI